LLLRLDDAYFQRLQRGFTGAQARISILPYSFQLAPQSTLGLKEVMTRVFGPKAEMSVAPSVQFGGEDALPAGLVPGEPLALAAALFNLTATPEAENHGAFLAAVAKQLPRGTPLVALVDEASFRQRFDGHDTRLDERRKVWRQVLAAQGAEPAFVDLAQPDPAPSADALTTALDRISRAQSAA
jgi:hypothetical protein